jgi:hypothetical protein
MMAVVDSVASPVILGGAAPSRACWRSRLKAVITGADRIELLTGTVVEPWSGSFSGETLTGTMSGTTEVEWSGLLLSVDWTAGFDITR